MKIGIMGGTFDPIHIGHLIIAEHVRDEYKLDKLILILSKNPPHKNNEKIVSAETRFEMLKVAVGSNNYLEASDMEIKRSGKSYTVDTLKYFSENYPADDIYFICGADSIKNIHHWKSTHELFNLASFIVADRMDEDFDLQKCINHLKVKYNSEILVSNVPVIDISSTLIRNKIRQNKSIKYLVTKEVEQYIKNNNIYI